jgi:hypothetical protein
MHSAALSAAATATAEVSLPPRPNALVVDRLDAGLGVGAVVADLHLPARVAHSGQPLGLQGNRQQRRRGLLAGGSQHVELAAMGIARAVGSQLFGQTKEAVGFAAHGAGHDHHLMARAVPFGNPARHVSDALGGPHGGAAVFVNDQGH